MSDAWLWAIAVPMVVSFGVIAIVRRSRWAVELADEPNERSLHGAPTPRGGGLGVLAGAIPVAAVFADPAIATILACATLLAVVSLRDDWKSLPIEVRLPAHAAAAAVAVLVVASPGSGHPGVGAVEATLAVLALVWMTNLFNFMDGSDGLAGGMAAIGFATFAIAAFTAGEMPLALACAALAAANVGFLAHNFPPARVFLGDAGSVPLGFLAGALGLLGMLAGAWPPWFPVLVFSAFIADASATLAKRIARGERFWRAHRSHYYQRMVLAGWTRRRLALAAYELMLAAAASALLARGSGERIQFGIILVWAVAYALAFIAIDRRARTTRSSTPLAKDQQQ